MNLNIKSFDIRKAWGSMGRIWQKTHTFLFFVFLIIMIVLGGYVWRRSLYQGTWSDQRKQEYLNSQGKVVVFNEDEFNKVLNDIQARKDENAKSYQPLKDVFKAYK